MNQFFNAQHSPIGAFSSFTLGFKRGKGGLGIGLGKPADQNIFVGFEDDDGRMKLLPFFSAETDESKRFAIEKEEDLSTDRISVYKDHEMTRDYGIGHDTWIAGPMTFSILNPVIPAANPDTATDEEMKACYLPSILVEMTLDNRSSSTSKQAVFGFEGTDVYRTNPGMRPFHTSSSHITGMAQGHQLSIATDEPSAKTACSFNLDRILDSKTESNWRFGIGGVGALIIEVPAKTLHTVRFTVSFYQEGLVTSGLDGKYWYTKLFSSVEDVSSYALTNFQKLKTTYEKGEQSFKTDHLSKDQYFMLAHSIHSYYASTALYSVDDKPLFAVMEGEYRMINTLDLFADQIFYDCTMHPWTVKNRLDWFLSNYSYKDHAFLPNDNTPYPGGLSFTHDMGVSHVFSPNGYSCYELAQLDDCYSYMTAEQLVNWALCALVYVNTCKDTEWEKAHLPIFKEILESLVNRDHPDPELRDGVVSLDSSRCEGGSEITTYDSLDVSLAQTRNNIYHATKSWSVYIGLQKLFEKYHFAGDAALAHKQAVLCANTLANGADENGFMPAILNENNFSRIIPVIEGLVFPNWIGCPEAISPTGEYLAMLKTLTTHFERVLVPGICLFEDGGWKLSSTSNNSWLSKIYICQHVAENVLKIKNDEKRRVADQVHVSWLLDPELSYWCWSDQILAGKIMGSKYYPRGVSTILWLNPDK